MGLRLMIEAAEGGVMRGTRTAVFPDFQWDEYFWVTSALLPAWSGLVRRSDLDGEGGPEDSSDPRVLIVFAPEGRDGKPLQAREVRLVQWVIDHQAEVILSALQLLYEEYPRLREEAWEWFEECDAQQVLPEILQPEALRELERVTSINVHPLEQEGQPFIGVELECTWDEEHGLGVLFHGARALELGGADGSIAEPKKGGSLLGKLNDLKGMLPKKGAKAKAEAN